MNRAAIEQRDRLKVIPWIIGVAFLLIVLRLFYLQVQSSLALFLLSKRNCFRFEKITPPRGNILDCHGNLIATNRPMHQLVWKGSGNRTFDDEQLRIIATLRDLLAVDLQQDREFIKAEYQGKTFTIATEINFEHLSYILEQFPNHKNLAIQTGFKRYYPHGHTACHILGYLSGMSYEPTGRMGLEKIFDEALRGTPGQRLTTINSVGRHLRQEEIQKALSGDNLQTTLSIDLHKIAEKSFPQEYTGVLLAMDAKTGAIRVMLSQPTFDPNIFLEPVSHEQWQGLQQNRPFINRILSGCYPPASLFKLVTLITALEQGIINEDTLWHCRGSIEFCKRSYHCKNRTGHGLITTQEALAKSCNIPFYEIGKRIKIDTLAHYAHIVGLGTKASNLLPEKLGLIPTSYWKRTTLGKPWWPGETVLACIGQGPIEVTPLQIARMIGAIGEGFTVIPRILESEPIEQHAVPISKKTLNFMRNCMESTIRQGTGQRLNRLKNFKLYGKSGTAQVRAFAKGSTGNGDEHGWFAAHSTYKDNSPLVLIVLVEGVGSSSFATEIAKNFLQSYANYIDGIDGQEKSEV
jgi:penicillin-binding protein 2